MTTLSNKDNVLELIATARRYSGWAEADCSCRSCIQCRHVQTMRTLADELEKLAAELAQSAGALKEIAFLRPAGDVDTCKAPRKLVERMEQIAFAALSAPTREQGA